ncbi:hypothetical protein FT663_04278 [Candidozyma haemuli var. vulneris]|uniref:Uncharacterized protein n=1 Tax=Candidozyma haemuli TaxID=45357 RepID=A0A2V1AQ01_9ASCO|nr:hypothetical protein CXQ85_003642 [[Candida] haemuloni]KAF3986776.1 hypothetical protein FT662_04386 [[Candida] haemuloni var. vulneris]KAF3987885.1 hypothetical protein FT663_04278 [[Candida] haemuloni var. vulneris]PVH19784.1 hypothetical protein CXQ85_003642 [[Candida] haemuloni]
MEWQQLRPKRSSISGLSQSGGSYNSYPLSPTGPQAQSNSRFAYPNYPPDEKTVQDNLYFQSGTAASDRASYYSSQHPLFCADWVSSDPTNDWVVLSSFREGYQNRVQVVHGSLYTHKEEEESDEKDCSSGIVSPTVSEESSSSEESRAKDSPSCSTGAFDWTNVAETAVEYPLTNVQWDPQMQHSSGGVLRLGASSEVLRLYKVDQDPEKLKVDGRFPLVQTHLLANNSTANTSSNGDAHDINTFPPVTSFDWNKTDSSIIITSSVDTTCTVWDLNRSHSLGKDRDTAHVKTQLIAHDSEVFDVKFLHQSTNVFASVSNDGSMRVFDLRSLEHSTIIYEPTRAPPLASSVPTTAQAHYNPQALLKLSTSNIDQHNLATVGVNSNQVLVIDMRMPGLPVVKLDCSFGGMSQAAVNTIQWHPATNWLATAGDDCQALVWDLRNGNSTKASDVGTVMDTPMLAYNEELEVNNVCWRQNSGDWLGVISGKGFQALQV